MSDAAAKSIVLFDGVCNFCNGTVRFIIARDPDARFAFASLQSRVARELLTAHGLEPSSVDPDTIVLIEDDVAHDRSTAALRIARRLRGPIKLTYGFILVPRFIRDWAYRLFARNRYRWFGRTETCPIPPPGVRTRFLDAGEAIEPEA